MTGSLASLLSRPEFWVLGLAVAAFLVLFWALRGAPVGDATEEVDDEAPRASYRDRVIAAVVVGLLLVVGGAYVALTRSIAWSLPPFAVGFGIVLTLIGINRRYRHASPALRRTVEFSNAALTTTLVAGVLIVINVLAFRYGGRALDFTRERAFSLSSLSLNQLKALDRPVTFTLFFGGSPLEVLQSDRVRQLLEVYKAANPGLVRLEQVRRYAEAEKFNALAKRVPDITVTQGGGVLIEYGEGDEASRVVVRNHDLFDLPQTAQLEANTQRLESKFHGENAVTSALIDLREEKKPKIAFSTGHGEPSINDSDPRRPGISRWKARLGAVGSDVVELNLIRDEIPLETSLFVIVAPKSPFKNDEIAKLKAYSERGGPLLVLVGNQDKSGLDDFLKFFNVRIGSGLAVDRRLSVRGRPFVVFVPISGALRHPIVDSLMNHAALMPTAAPVSILGNDRSLPSNPNIVAVPILRTSAQSWAETEPSESRVQLDAGKDERGPLTVGVAVSDRPQQGSQTEGKPRLVLFSSGTLADNQMIEFEPTNQDLLMNSISWLRGRGDLKGIGPTAHEALTLVADPILRTRLVLVPTVMAVLLIVGLGVTTYLARRE